MIVRALSPTGDWTFGQGTSNYLSGNQAIEQEIQTTLNSFLGNCFFAATSGIDWYNLLGNKNQLAIVLAINAALLKVPGVTGILQTNVTINSNRNFSLSYSVTTIYSTLTSTYEFNDLI